MRKKTSGPPGKSPARSCARAALVSLGAIALIGGLFGALARSQRTSPATTSSSPARTTTEHAGATAAAVRIEAPAAGPDQARTAPADDSTHAALLRRALHQEDPIARVQVVDDLVERRDVGAIDELARLDLDADDPSARAVMSALGVLGGAAPAGPLRRASLERLLELLRTEHGRAEPDPGNVLVLVEALGDLGDPGAARALEAELGQPPLDVAGWTTVVRALARAGTRDNLPALERLRAQVAASQTKDAYEGALARELVAAANEAIAQLSARHD